MKKLEIEGEDVRGQLSVEEDSASSSVSLRTRMGLCVCLIAVILVIGLSIVDAKELLSSLLFQIDDLGPWGPSVFIVLYIVCTILFFPGSIVSLGAGVVFGVAWGTVYVSVGSTLGATCAFLIGRYLARSWVSARIAGNRTFRAINRAVAAQGWKIVLLTRLSPVFPYNLLNYAFGLTRVSLGHYFFSSWIGMLPGILLYVYLGSLAGELARLSVDQPSKSALVWAMHLLGLISTIVLVLCVAKISRDTLKSQEVK